MYLGKATYCAADVDANHTALPYIVYACSAVWHQSAFLIRRYFASLVEETHE